MFKASFGKTKYISVPHESSKTGGRSGENRCPSCAVLLSGNEVEKKHKVCPACRYHFSLGARERLHLLVEKSGFREFDTDLQSCNPLEFPEYDDKLAQARQASGLGEAIITGQALIGAYTVVLGIMDSRFMMGSMGSVVGEKVCRAVEHAIEDALPLLLFTTSGGARMQEGMLSLMQMAKTSAAINRLHEKGILYVSILTHPTTGGVSASFASLADIIIAEPGALIGFTGPRVIQQTLGQRLPERFQRAEFLLEHGMIDLVIDRLEMKDTLLQILQLHRGGSHGKKAF